MLQQCFVGVEAHDPDVHAYLPYYDEGAGLHRLPNELVEMIAKQLPCRDLRSLRQSNKRLAMMTTHLLLAHCHTNRTCVNAEYGLQTLIQGSRAPLLNGTITSLTLSAPSWKDPLASYGAGLREVLLLRLNTLRLYSISITQSKDLLHLLTSHAASLRHLHFHNVHLSDLSSWREVLVHISRMDRLQRLELKHLFYTVNQTATFILPRSTYGACITEEELEDCDSESRWSFQEKARDQSVAYSPQEIGSLIDDFFTETGALQKDFGHELMLAAPEQQAQEASWMQTATKWWTGS